MEKHYTLTPEQIEGIKEHDLKRSQLVQEVNEKYEAKRKAKEDFWNSSQRKGNQKTK